MINPATPTQLREGLMEEGAFLVGDATCWTDTDAATAARASSLVCSQTVISSTTAFSDNTSTGSALTNNWISV